MKPDIIIAIDSLAARNVRRITTTIQLTNTGITPGSGIGNHRKGLNEQSLNTKVIAIGVPMVVSGATIVNDTMEKLFGNTYFITKIIAFQIYLRTTHLMKNISCLKNFCQKIQSKCL